ncbi:MAG TPA: isocitrate/isopropylmalate family dehydrogenase [Thermodesulfobacteriota bacterium]
MMLKYSFDMNEASDIIERAVEKVLAKGYRTADIMQPGMTRVSCVEMGEAVLKAL